MLESSDKARTWATVNFDKLQNFYPSERSRVITALDYLDQQGLMELQTKQMTNVYKVSVDAITPELTSKLAKRFSDKRAKRDKAHPFFY